MNTTTDPFPSVFAALLVAHYVGDYILQTGYQAVHKGDRDLAGWLTAGRHAASYTAATGALVGLVWATLGLSITVGGFIAGQAVSGLSHWVIDRRYTLRAAIVVLDRVVPGKLAYYEDCPGGGEKVDQAAHVLCLLAAALVTASF